MRLTILAVTSKRVPWVAEGTDDYLRRFTGRWRATLKEIKAEPRHDSAAVDRALLKEKERFEAALEPNTIWVVLEERGESWTTLQLAERLRGWEQAPGKVAFLIGGADGFHPSIPAAAQARLSLSKLTMQHGVARLVLAEQLYRAWSVIQGHPYHREG